MRDRSYEHQINKATGLNPLVAAIILWKTKYLEASMENLRQNSVNIPDEIERHIAPLVWANVGLTGDYQWNPNTPFSPDLFEKHEFRDAA